MDQVTISLLSILLKILNDFIWAVVNNFNLLSYSEHNSHTSCVSAVTGYFVSDFVITNSNDDNESPCIFTSATVCSLAFHSSSDHVYDFLRYLEHFQALYYILFRDHVVYFL